MENKNRQSSGSLFLSIPGLLVLAVFLIISFYFKATLISVFLLLFLILCLIAFFWSRRVSTQLSADGRILTGSCFPDENLQLELQLTNDGPWAAIWTDAYLPVDHPELIAPQNGIYADIEMAAPAFTGKALHQKFTWLSGYQQLSCKLTLTAKKRGILHINHIYLNTGDGFGISSSKCGNPPKGDLSAVIFPKLYPVNTQQLLLKGNTMSPGKRGQYEDITLLRNIRPYQFGDSFKRINWRMLAKKQEFMVNLYEQITPESIFFLLDLHSFSYQIHRPGGNDEDMMDCVHEENMELAISLVASCIATLSEQGVACGLIIPGYGQVAPEFFYGEGNSHHLDEILLLLAQISYTGGPVTWPGEQLEYLTAGMGKSYVITEASPDPQLFAFDFMETAATVAVEASEQTEGGDTLNLSDLFEI